VEPLILMLRGVNVGSANRLPMADFRDMLAGLGLERVQTYVQSGNAVFLGGQSGLEARVEAALLARFGLAVPVFMLTRAGMAAVLAANPFAAEGAADGASVHIFFLQGTVAFDAAGLATHSTAGERFWLGPQALYLHTPQGFGRSAVAQRLPRYLKAEMTARNQRSATALLEMAKALTGT
jgi:uncharacterized protein (DUF1697 family)